MPFQTTPLPGLLVFEPKVFEDSRGYFFEAYSDRLFQEAGIAINFVQDNQSFSKHGVIRGLHYQLNPYAQSKLLRVLDGHILDVVVDIRVGSPTYRQTYSIELSAGNKKQLFVPVGFAHGFCVLSETATVMYKCDAFWNKDAEGGIRFDDPALNIDWGLPKGELVLNQKDLELPTLANCQNNFVFAAKEKVPA
jgi:dTDP-4-dehydrorhamnose 3,5-epimerase